MENLLASPCVEISIKCMYPWCHHFPLKYNFKTVPGQRKRDGPLLILGLWGNGTLDVKRALIQYWSRDQLDSWHLYQRLLKMKMTYSLVERVIKQSEWCNLCVNIAKADHNWSDKPIRNKAHPLEFVRCNMIGCCRLLVVSKLNWCRASIVIFTRCTQG